MDLPEKGEVVELERLVQICRENGLDALAQKIEDDPPQRPFRCDGCFCFSKEF